MVGQPSVQEDHRTDAATVVKALWQRFLSEEDAQDLMEYALLGVFVGVVGVLVWNSIVTLIGARYGEYNSNVQDLWAPPEPPTSP